MARTIKLYRLEFRRPAPGCRRLPGEPPAHLEAQWQLFLATAAQGLYVRHGNTRRVGSPTRTLQRATTDRA